MSSRGEYPVALQHGPTLRNIDGGLTQNYTCPTGLSTLLQRDSCMRFLQDFFASRNRSLFKWQPQPPHNRGAMHDGGPSNKVKTFGGQTVGGESNHETKFLLLI